MVQIDFVLALYIRGLCGRGNQINMYYRIMQIATQLVTVWKEEIINLQQNKTLTLLIHVEKPINRDYKQGTRLKYSLWCGLFFVA